LVKPDGRMKKLCDVELLRERRRIEFKETNERLWKMKEKTKT